MTFGDFIRAVKADLKHDDSIVEDYDWNRLMSFKELDIKRFDELVDIIKNLRVNTSKNITKIYIFQWFFIPILIILFVFFFKNINISDLICFIMGIAVLLISGTCNRIIDKTTTICSH